MPEFLGVKVDAHAAKHGDGGERVRLPTQIVELEAAIDGGQRESKKGPEGSEPACGQFVPHQESEQECRGGGVKIRGDEAVRRAFIGCPARDGVQAGSDKRYGDQPNAEGAVVPCHVAVVIERSNNGRDGEEMFLNAEMEKVPAASSKRENDSCSEKKRGHPNGGRFGPDEKPKHGSTGEGKEGTEDTLFLIVAQGG